MLEALMRIGCILLVAGLVAGPANAEPATGPVIPGHGPVYYVPEEPQAWPAGQTLKAVFDIAGAPDAPEDANPRFEMVARYLNLHARAGIAPEQLPVAVVLHGRATRSALDPDVFEERYGEAHPDAGLLKRLQAAGVRIVVCGQSATAFGFDPAEFAPGIGMSLSAMTSLVALQSEGYALIPWGAD
jgi:intracellular sulfur oxidation DsrE/DsrF family protein